MRKRRPILQVFIISMLVSAGASGESALADSPSPEQAQNLALAYIPTPYSPDSINLIKISPTLSDSKTVISPRPLFTADQEHLMQDLSRVINVGNGGFWLAWRLTL